MEFLQELNEQQKQAVYEEHSRICVIAGPGCGKTRTLVSFPDSKFPVYDRHEQETVVRKIIYQLNYNADQKEINTILAYISGADDPLEFDEFTKKRYEIYQKYQEYLQTNKALDFNDLLLHTITLFNYYPQVREEYQKQFSHILLDEFQDINAIQWEIIKLILSDKQNVFLVGDPNQAIYGFQGATPELISSFKQELIAQKIPYEILGSFKFIQREEIKDVLALLRAIVYQDNLSLARMLSLQEKIGTRTIEKIEQNSEKEGISIYNYLNNFATITNLTQEKLAAGQVERIEKKRRKEYPNLGELLNNFLQWIIIAFEDKKLIKTRNNLILSSIHQAKGLEFEVVFFVYLDQGTLPYKETQDLLEEKRLFYVGITRAKKLLYLLSSKALYSPFLDELEHSFLNKM
ncbi:6473_t:CDS:2 [Funneliformis geosporum]|nr:6473_t:CDS:2 [Funneliformis geosporum]